MKMKISRRKVKRCGDTGVRDAVRYLAKTSRINRRDVRFVLMAFRAFIESELRAGRTFRWQGVGIFFRYLRKGRTVTLPATAAKRFAGMTLTHKTAYYPHFKVSPAFKQRTKTVIDDIQP